MITTVVKANGKRVPFNPEKLNRWAEWAANLQIPWSSLVLGAVRKCYDGCTTSELHDALIAEAVDQETEAHLRFANRLFIGKAYKRAFGHWDKIPTVKQQYKRMRKLGLWEDMGYSDHELDLCETFIDHSRDVSATLTETKQVMDKYGIIDRVDNIPYETPQFVFMRMALGNMKLMPHERRMEDVKYLYEYLSQKKINAPSPFTINLGTPKRQYASCCVYTTRDSAPSLAASDHIAYMMTCASAGIGGCLHTRSKGDKVRSGQIVHQGKLPYLRVKEASVAANIQASRGGALTEYFTVLDPEWDDLIKLKNVQTVAEKQIKNIDYSVVYNTFFAERVANNGTWMQVSVAHAAQLYTLFFSDKIEAFKEEYHRVEVDPTIPKKIVSARKMADFLIEAVETGRIYETNIEEMNRHTPFYDPIHSSNLCVAPETTVLTDKGFKVISEIAGEFVNVWNGEEWSNVQVLKTGENQKLLRVTLSDGKTIDCTPYHKFYVEAADGELVERRAHELQRGDYTTVLAEEIKELVIYVAVESVQDLGRVDDTYCFNEPKRHMGVFNGILTGQCLEIALPTQGFESVAHLYDAQQGADKNGEIGLCNLGAIAAGLVSEEEYEKVAYYTCLMIDNVMEIMDYPFPHLAQTAKARRSIGVGITNLAHDMASRGLKYSTEEGKLHIAALAERHSFYLHKAALKLAKERGCCEWTHRTKYSRGWLPIDTANYYVLNKIGYKLQQDWEALREEILAQGGLRFSVLESHMPCESSSVASGHTNGLYPIREYKVVKTSGSNKNLFICPEYDKLKDSYEMAWDVPTMDMIDVYGIVQAFTGQAISADIYNKFRGDVREIGKKQLLQEWLYRVKVGMKTRYYINSSTGVEKTATAVVDVSGDCEACKL